VPSVSKPRWSTKVTAAERRDSDGEEVIDFIEDFCRITKDTVAGPVGTPIRLFDWQKALLTDLFARRVRDGRRKHRQALIGLPRKNGKSAIGSGIGLYGLLLGPAGGEVYSCAGDREQARIVFGMAKRMVELEPTLAEQVKVYRDVIEVPASGSIYRVLSAEAYTKEGLSPTLVIFDEVHVQPSSELWDVMNLGSGARLEPLVLGITTAGSRTDSLGRDSLCYSLYQHGQRVVNGEVDDPSFYFAWWEPKLGTEADHRDPKVWAEANPGLGTIVDVEDFKSTVVRTSESEFRTKRTNCWVIGQESALGHGVWDRCADSKRQVTKDDPVVLFFDGSWAGDSTGLVGATIGETPHLFVVDLWERPADVDWRVPILEVEERIRQACREFQVVEVACDPYRWQRSIATLEAERLPMVEWPMNIARVVPAWQAFSEAAIEGRLTHDGNPSLARHVENMVLKRDQRGVRPVKESKSSRRHIDLGICAMGAHDRAISRAQLGPAREFFGAWA
jgi:phage terminase large subunit-like protein